MRRFGRALGRVLIALIVLGGGLWLLGPYEEVDLKAGFDPGRFGGGVQAYFDTVESRFADITPGTEKRVIWAGQPETRTPLAVLYLHGFSATSEEIRPVPDRVAAALGANLVFTRLRGHGRDGQALARASVNDWVQDTAEALAAARAVGDRVVVMATSTGGTLAALAALDPQMSRDVAAMVLISPNFAINDPAAPLLTFPAARWWLPLVAGRERSSVPRSPEYAKYWTKPYPTEALFAMAALVKAVAGMDFSAASVPLLLRISDADQVVRPEVSRAIAARWGGGATVQTVVTGPGDDPGAHVIAGAIRSPGQTEAAIGDILGWLKQIGL